MYVIIVCMDLVVTLNICFIYNCLSVLGIKPRRALLYRYEILAFGQDLQIHIAHARYVAFTASHAHLK